MKGLIRRLSRLDRRWWDYTLAGAILVAGEIELLGRSDPTLPAVLAVGLGYAWLALRRRRPVLAGVGMYVTWFTISLIVYDVQPAGMENAWVVVAEALGPMRLSLAMSTARWWGTLRAPAASTSTRAKV